MNDNKTIFVYSSFLQGIDELIGILYVDNVRGKENYSFEYDDMWLVNHSFDMPLDLEISQIRGRQYPNDNRLFGMFQDSSPDRWGRVLMNQKERIEAEKEKRKPRKLQDSDYLLGVYDKTRMGGLRFKLSQDEVFLANDEETAVPPWTTLRTLEEASRRIESGKILENEKWLNQLIRPGSSLGGARPKASVIDNNEQLWIAKFPSQNDEYDVGAWEKVATDLAQLCGLNVPESKIEIFSKYGSTFLAKRFDRLKNKRIHFSSAMSLLGKIDLEEASYLDIVSFIRSNGSNVTDDLLELFRRIVFFMAISNTDDHLRNHAFLYEIKGWRLSPLYDVNPVPYGEQLTLNISQNDNRISFELAIENSSYFGIKKDEATNITKSIVNVVKDNWEKLAHKYKIKKEEIEMMRPAFSECYK